MNQAISTSSLASLRYTPQLWNPTDISFIVSIFMVGLFLIGIIYFIPLYFPRFSSRFKHILMIKDSIFIILFSGIYLILISDAGKAINKLTFIYLQYDITVLYFALFTGFIAGRTFFSRDTKGTIYTFSITFILLVILSICSNFYLAYNL